MTIPDSKFDIIKNAKFIEEMVGMTYYPHGITVGGFSVKMHFDETIQIRVTKPTHNPILIAHKYEIGFWEPYVITPSNSDLLRWSWIDQEMKDDFENSIEFKNFIYIISNLKVYDPLMPPEPPKQNTDTITIVIPITTIKKIAKTPLQFLAINDWTFVATDDNFYLSTRYKGTPIGTFQKYSRHNACLTFKLTKGMEYSDTFDALGNL